MTFRDKERPPLSPLAWQSTASRRIILSGSHEHLLVGFSLPRKYQRVTSAFQVEKRSVFVRLALVKAWRQRAIRGSGSVTRLVITVCYPQYITTWKVSG